MQNETMRPVLRTTKVTPIETTRFMLDPPPMRTRQSVEQVKAYFSAVENPHNPLREAVKNTKGYKLGRTLLPQNLGKQRREWTAGRPESEIKLLIPENNKPQDLIVYTDGSVTKTQPGWGFTVKQRATTIHEDSGDYTVSTSSLTVGESSCPCPPLDCLKR